MKSDPRKHKEKSERTEAGKKEKPFNLSVSKQVTDWPIGIYSSGKRLRNSVETTVSSDRMWHMCS